MNTVFLRLLSAGDKAAALRHAIAASDESLGDTVFVANPKSFTAVPRSPFAYWVRDEVRIVFAANEALESSGRDACSGATTNDDQRFIRFWAEVPPESVARRREETSSRRWVVLSKGGEFARFFVDMHLVVDWQHDGRSLKAHIAEYRGNRGWGYQWSAALNGYANYFRPGLTWSRRSQRGLSLRVLPRGGLFGDKGPAVFVPHDREEGLLALLAITNSAPFRGLVALQMAFGSYEVGVLERTPIPGMTNRDELALARLARRAWSLKRSLDKRSESSHAFVLPALLQVAGDTLVARADAWASGARATEAEVAAIQAEIDDRCFTSYGISDADRRSITEDVGGSTAAAEGSDEEAADIADVDEEVGEGDTADTVTLAAELVSWALGVAFGRFDIRLATGERELPGEPEPFDPLPVCSPAMLTGADGLPLATPPGGYPVTFPTDGILLDDVGHPRDLTAAVRTVFEIVFGSRADAAWQEAGALLDPKGHDVSTWLRAGFFEHHLRRHSKSRRKAPIVWQMGTSSGRYSIFAYAHRLTRDSLFALQNDIAAPRLAVEERRLASLRTQAGASPSARERAEIEAAEAAVDEMRTVLAELRRITPLWNPDLDDGIVLMSAPLWRLVSGHKPWQKELRSRWDDLTAGKYDWAHLAMHLWPERVIPKCASDRSLAIAHGLEGVFWVEGADGKWTKRSRPTRPIEELVAKSTTSAVKAALADLAAAPALNGGSGRERGRR